MREFGNQRKKVSYRFRRWFSKALSVVTKNMADEQPWHPIFSYSTTLRGHPSQGREPDYSSLILIRRLFKSKKVEARRRVRIAGRFHARDFKDNGLAQHVDF